MTAKDLKNALLQEAVQGKLVPQISSEGNARDLLEEIRKEKSKLVKEGIIKKEKPLPEINEENIPFDIPENWCWCRLGDFCDVVTGSLDANAQDEKGKYAFFTCGVEVYKTKQYAFDCDAILLGGNNASGDYKMHRYNGKFNAYQRVYVISGANKIILDYFEYVIKYWLPHLKKNSQGTTTRFIKLSQVNGMYVPLPPLAEQKRIVAAIEKFMPLIEEYGKKETELKAFNEQIGALTKKAILQEAVQGKLVPQNDAEGNAKDLLEEIKKEKAKLIKEGKIKKEKPLPEITEDEIPFDIPDNWCYIRPTDIGYFSSGKTPELNEITNEGYIPYFKVSDMNNKGNELYMTTVIHYLTNNSKYKLFPKNSIIYPKNGGAVFTNKKRILITDSLVDLNTGVFIPIEGIYIKYFYLLFSSIDFKQYYKGTALPTVDLEAVQKIVWALPPLAEQKRIVAAIEKMLPLCEKLGEK